MSTSQDIVREYKDKLIVVKRHGQTYELNAHEVYEGVWYDFAHRHQIEEFSMADFNRWKSAQVDHAEELAAAGAIYLDKHYPEWRNVVFAQSLDMASSSQCVLGQLFGDYDEGINEIWNKHFRTSIDDENENDVGHDLGFLSNGACYMALDLAWQKELTKRKDSQ